MKAGEIKKIIAEQGLSLSEVASILEISPQLLNSWLSVSDIKVGRLIDISEAINKNLYEVLERLYPVTRKRTHGIAAEPPAPYEMKPACKECEAKERLIEQLQKENDRLWKMIEGNNGRKQNAS